jgi:hypothetical protein
MNFSLIVFFFAIATCLSTDALSAIDGKGNFCWMEASLDASKWLRRRNCSFNYLDKTFHCVGTLRLDKVFYRIPLLGNMVYQTTIADCSFRKLLEFSPFH